MTARDMLILPNTAAGKGVWFWREPQLRDCPCGRAWPGCVSYKCLDTDPFYVCHYSHLAAYVLIASSGHGFE
jgi:hypothetical protein